MAQTCSQCLRANPEDAEYCHFDGRTLKGPAGTGGPVDVGRQAFPVPFVWPPERVCRDFNELALACHDHWDEAAAVLGRGDLQRFFVEVGRHDLAAAARAAAEFPDPDRGWDALLAQLPGDALEAPRLRVEPLEVSLGQLRPGENRTLELRLVNQGMRLISGATALGRTAWLALGDGPAGGGRPFQFLHECTLSLRVVGSALRSGSKPLEARIVCESTGGRAVIVVRAEVPVTPFPDGLLAGALSPRQLAEKARTAAKQAAALFESGAVAAWYRANGWDYPVRIPTATGIAAVQQFFEALGLTKPPPVALAETQVSLHGAVGKSLGHELTVTTTADRAVYAHAVSDRPWLDPKPAQTRGRTAVLPLVVTVPNRAGETLTAQVTVTANGNRRFVVPVTLTVDAAPVAARPPTPRPPAPPKHWLDFVPLTLLAVALLALAGRDLTRGSPPAPPLPPAPAAPVEVLDPNPLVAPLFHDQADALLTEPTMRFGIVLLREQDPTDSTRLKRLTYDELGRSNNTCLKVDGVEYLFGERPGHWLAAAESLGKDDEGHERPGLRSVWELDASRLVVEQRVEVVRGEQSRRFDTCRISYTLENTDKLPHTVGLRMLLDTFIGANDAVPFLIPGATGLCDQQLSLEGDAVPEFLQALEREDLESPGTIAYLRLRLGGSLEPAGRVTLGAWPDVRLAARPGGRKAKAQRTGWEVPVLPMKTLPPGDSAVSLYWNERPLAPGHRREVGFTYGLGNLSGGEGQGRLAVTVGGSFAAGGRFVVTAYVRDPLPDQTLSVELPEGFSLPDGQEAQRPVPQLSPDAATHYSPVTWHVLAPQVGGRHTLRVASSNGAAQTQEVVIGSRLIFD